MQLGYQDVTSRLGLPKRARPAGESKDILPVAQLDSALQPFWGKGSANSSNQKKDDRLFSHGDPQLFASICFFFFPRLVLKGIYHWTYFYLFQGSSPNGSVFWGRAPVPTFSQDSDQLHRILHLRRALKWKQMSPRESPASCWRSGSARFRSGLTGKPF